MSKESVSKEQLQAWRRQHEALFQLSDGETEYYVRPLTFEEHEEAIALHERGLDAMAEEYVLLQSVIHPVIDSEAIDDMPAGIAHMVEEILALSAFIDAKKSSEILDNARESMIGDLWSAAAAFIIIAIPSMNLDDLRSMGMRRLMEHVALAEQVLKLDHELRRGEMPELVVHQKDQPPPSAPPPSPQQQRQQGQAQQPPQSQNPEEQAILDEMRSKMQEAQQYL